MIVGAGVGSDLTTGPIRGGASLTIGPITGWTTGAIVE